MISSTIATALATVAAATEESRQCVANLTIPFAQAAHHARGLRRPGLPTPRYGARPATFGSATSGQPT